MFFTYLLSYSKKKLIRCMFCCYRETESAKSVTAANDKIVEAPSDPATVMSGTQLNKEKKGKKKKKKSAKLSKLEKATVRK